MKISADKFLQQWIEEHINTAVNNSYASIHVDQIVGRDYYMSDRIHISLRVLEFAISQLRLKGFPVQPILIMPLESANRPEAVAPLNLEQIELQLTSEPPGLYLLRWDAERFIDEVRIPLPFDLMNGQIADVHCYYREYRYNTLNQSEPEFDRDIYAAYEPVNVEMLQ